MTRGAGKKGVDDAVAALAAAFDNPLRPPQSVTLRPGTADRRIWAAIMRARAREEWSQIDLQHAGNLVRTMSDVERLSREIAVEGDVLRTGDISYLNPKHRLLEQMTRRAVALTRLLHLHAGTLIDDPGKLAGMRRQEKEARESQEALLGADDDLLARPPSIQ